MNRTIIIGKREYNIVSEDFDEDVDIDDLLKIDLSNLIGELVTFPVIVNRFGVMVAAIDRKIGEQKLMLDLYEAKLKDRIRRDWSEAKAPTVDQINSAIDQDDGYMKKKLSLIKLQEEKAIVESAKWCAADKSEKLNKLSLSLQSGDLEEAAHQQKVNGFKVAKVSKKRLIE